MKNPWIKWYSRDHSSDSGLRMCSLGARGLWVEMLGLMHHAEPVGSLVINGRQVTAERLAVIVGAPAAAVSEALAELEDCGVFSRDEDGTIYSRRMRRDVAKAERDRANGASGGNPNLKPRRDRPGEGGDKPNGNPTDKAGVNPPEKGEDKAQKPEARGQKPEARIFIEEAGRPASSREPACEAGEGAAAPPAGPPPAMPGRSLPVPVIAIRSVAF